MMGRRGQAKGICSMSSASTRRFLTIIWCGRSMPSWTCPGSTRSWRSLLAARPPFDRPVLMIRMLIAGYVFAIRSERQLCREVQVNLAYRWFCELDPGRSDPRSLRLLTARTERFLDSDIFRCILRARRGSLHRGWPGGGEGFAVDASLIEADANRQRSIPGKEWHKERDPEAASRR